MARVEATIDKVNKHAAKLIEKNPELFSWRYMSQEQIQFELDNCVKWECYKAASFLQKIINEKFKKT